MTQFILNLLFSFFKQEITLTKFKIRNKLADALTFFIVIAICLTNSILFLLFASLAIYHYIKEWHGDTGIALLCAASLNIITMLLFVLFRKRWIKPTLSKLVSKFME